MEGLVMILGYLIGFVLVIGVAGLVLAFLMSLGSKIVLKQRIPYMTRFSISTVSLLGAFIIQMVTSSILGQPSGPSPAAVLPAAAYVTVAWGLTTGYLNKNTEVGKGNAGKGLLIAVIQFGGLMAIVGLIAFSIILLVRK